MKQTSGNKRTDTASKVIKASPQKIYAAFVDPKAVATWRPPEGMHCKVYEFDPREGGVFRMAFEYDKANHEVRGKTSEHVDVFKGRFLQLVPGKRVVEFIEFESDDPAFAGGMTITTNLVLVPGGTEVSFVCENVPDEIRPEDHSEGMTSSLKNLASFTE